MQIIAIDNTSEWLIESHGNGWAYSFTRKSDGATGWLQDTDATQWRANYEAMQIAVCNPQNGHYGRNWNWCLAFLCGDYLEASE